MWAQVAYLRPERVEMPAAVRQALSDAHVRLGGAACSEKQIVVLRADRSRIVLPVQLDAAGRVMIGNARVMVLDMLGMLRQARMAGSLVYVWCRDAEALQRAGVQPMSGNAYALGALVWQLEGLAWHQRQQRPGEEEEEQRRRREGPTPMTAWERRGGVGRRGRRRREPGVVFELGPHGEWRQALPHREAALMLSVPSVTTGEPQRGAW